MNIRKLTLLWSILLIGSHFLWAQEPEDSTARANMIGNDLITTVNDLNRLDGVTRTFDNRYEGVKGSPFVSEKWATGNVIDSRGVTYSKLELKFDAYEEAVVYKSSRGNMILDKERISRFVLTDPETGKERRFEKMELDLGKSKAEDPHFYEIIYDGPTQLLKQYEKIFQKADYQGAYSANRPYDEFFDKEAYYLRTPEGIYDKVKLSPKAFTKVLADQKKKLNAYIKAEQLYLETEAEAIQLLEYYDSL